VLNPDYGHLRPSHSRGQAIGALVLVAFTLLLGDFLLWIATENWWVAASTSVALASAGAAAGLWATIKRMRRGEELQRGEGLTSPWHGFIIGGGGAYLASRNLGPFVPAFLGLVCSLVAGVILAGVYVSRPAGPDEDGD
jgi:cobalamin synthase